MITPSPPEIPRRESTGKPGAANEERNFVTTTMAFLLSTVRHPKSFNRLAFSLQFRCNLTFNHLTDLRGVQHHLPRLPNLGDEPAFILIRRGAGVVVVVEYL